MKLIEKKCPGCGAGLKFGENDTSVTCEYCNKTLHIQRDEMKFTQLADKHIDRAYQFVDDYGKPLVQGFAAASIGMMIIPFVIFIIAVGGIGFTIFMFTNNDNNHDLDIPVINENKNDEVDSEQEAQNRFNEERKKYVLKLEQIDKVSLQTFYDTSITRLGNYNGSAVSGGTYADFSITKKWSKVGVYLLVGKETNENELYTILSQTYKNKKNGKQTIVYAAVSYDDLKLADNGIVENDYFGAVSAPSYELVTGDAFSRVNGYTSVEKLYNQLIRSKSGKYTIEASKGLYTE